MSKNVWGRERERKRRTRASGGAFKRDGSCDGSSWDKGWHKQKIAMCQKYYWFDKIIQILLMHRLKYAPTVKITLPGLSSQ